MCGFDPFWLAASFLSTLNSTYLYGASSAAMAPFSCGYARAYFFYSVFLQPLASLWSSLGALGVGLQVDYFSLCSLLGFSTELFLAPSTLRVVPEGSYGCICGPFYLSAFESGLAGLLSLRDCGRQNLCLAGRTGGLITPLSYKLTLSISPEGSRNEVSPSSGF